MRVFAVAFALSAAALLAVPAEARDDIMPPPKSAPRIPVEIHPLEGNKNAADPHELEGKGEALDGERIVIDGRELRLFGVVTPSLNSTYGPQTRLSLDRMLAGNTVLCKITDKDREGHPLAFCGTVKVPDLSYEMLRQGWAMVDRRALKGNALAEVYEKAEQEAQGQNRGIFAPTPMAMAVPVSDPAKSSMVPMPEQKTEQPPALPAPAPAAQAKETPALPDIRTAVEKISSAAAPEEKKEAPAPSGSFMERYQILFGSLMLLLTSGVYMFTVFWREKRGVEERRRSLAAALRGELMSARLICRTRARELLAYKKTDGEPQRGAQLWPRVRSFVYQAHVAHLGLLGAELARQVASVYGQFGDYAAYYQSASATRAPLPRAVGETLTTLADHVDTLLLGLAEVEATGRSLIGEDIMAEEDARAAADNVRLAMEASAKRALPVPVGPRPSVEAILRKRATPLATGHEEEESEEPEPAEAAETAEEAEEAEEKSAETSKAA